MINQKLPTIQSTSKKLIYWQNQNEKAGFVKFIKITHLLKTYFRCFFCKKDSLLIKMLLTFSAYTNAKKVFHIATNSGDQLQCIHAIRNLSFAWVVLGHTFFFGTSSISNSYEYRICFKVIIYSCSKIADNGAIAQDWQKKFSFQIIMSGLFSVDSFFMLRFVFISNI